MIEKIFVGEPYNFLESSILKLKKLDISKNQSKMLKNMSVLNKDEEYEITSFVYPVGRYGDKIEYGKIGFNNNIVDYKYILKKGKTIKKIIYNIKNRFRDFLTSFSLKTSYTSIIGKIKECSSKFGETIGIINKYRNENKKKRKMYFHTL